MAICGDILHSRVARSNIMLLNALGAQVRVVTGDDGEPWFVASDAARILGYREAHRLTRGLDDDERGPHIVGTPGGEQEVVAP